MGELREKRIVQSRIWLDPNQVPTPDYDYDLSYPITVYDAVKQNMEDNSATLTEELAGIYRLIESKQDIIDPGIAGQLMTWTGVRGQIGRMEIVKTINSDPSLRSYQKVVSERAIGDALDTKVSNQSFNNHVNDNSIHITDIERARWNAMAPLSTLQAHISNVIVHITDKERAAWNAKAEQKDLEDHIYNFNNPHNVTAHQVGTYSRREIDEMIENIRESFFNYLNISWDDRNNQATLVEYHPAQWNPNFVLGFNDTLPDVLDPSLTYFALKPATDYQTNETQDCIIYIKRPGLTWQEVGFQNMSVGDMVIRYPDTTMYVWVQGRFLKLFTGNNDDDITGGISDMLWRPEYNEESGELTFVLSKVTDPIGPFVIKGEDGYTPIKGIDYTDGEDGKGVAVGGVAGDILVKLTDENFDTSWKTLFDILQDFAISGGTLPDGLVIWDIISGRPQWYDSLGDNSDGFITQRAATRQFDVINTNITQLTERLIELEPVKQDLLDHLNDFNNPHRITPAIIGAVSMPTFIDHTQNFNNPHNTTAEQLGLGNVNNTSDMDKPISNATQAALDEIMRLLNVLTGNVDGLNFITRVAFNNTGCDLIFTYKDDTEVTLHLPIVDIFNTIYYDEAEKELVIVLPDGSENRISIANLIKTYFGSVSDNIQVIIEDDDVIKATIVPGSIGELEIAPSVHFRGSPTTMTQPVSDRSTRIATTEFVRGQVIDNLISYDSDRPLSANMGRILNERKADIEDVIRIVNDMEGVDVIDNLDSTSPLAALSANQGRILDATKAPRVHTSPSGSTFGKATINLFGHARASNVDPQMDGTVFKGTDDGEYARADHRHPTDKTRAPMNWPDVANDQYELTGKPQTVMPPDDSNDHQIANTEWVRRNAVGVCKGYCSTSKNNPNKTVTLKSTYCDPVVFIRQLGSTVSVLFDYEDRSGKTPTTLNVNDTGEAVILFGGRPMTNGMLGKNHEHMFVWDEYEDGSQYWRLINPVPGTGYGPIVIGPNKDEDPDTPEIEVNQMSGYNGFTLQADGDVDENGQVEYVWFTINYQPKVSDVEIEVSDYENAFAARMGDATDIILSRPKVVEATRTGGVVQFKLTKRYPSNSPCQLIYRTNKAYINISEI